MGSALITVGFITRAVKPGVIKRNDKSKKDNTLLILLTCNISVSCHSTYHAWK
jgi:hypothetical protein